MIDTAHRNPHIDHRGREDAFGFASVRADRAALKARRAMAASAGDDALLLCRQAAGTCDFDAGSVGGRLLPGDMVLIDAERNAAFTGDVAAMERLILPRRRLPAAPGMIEAAHGRVIDARSAFGLVLGGLLDAIRTPDAGRVEGEPEAGDAVLCALLSAAAAAAAEGAPAPAEEDPLLRSIREHIEVHLADVTLSPTTIGGHFGLSRATLYRLWRPLGGIAGHIRDRRLARARLHLGAVRNRRASIAEIAHRCGFLSEANFSRAYRRRYGCTPSQTVADALRRGPERDRPETLDAAGRR